LCAWPRWEDGCQFAEPGAEETELGREGGGLERGEVERLDRGREWGESFQRPGTAGEMGGSREQPFMFLWRGRILGGREDWGNTGSIKGWRDSSGDLWLWETREGPRLVLGREGGSLGGIGGGGDASLGGSGGVSPKTCLGLGGSGGGFPTGMGGREGVEMGQWGRMTDTFIGSVSLRLLSLSLGLVW